MPKKFPVFAAVPNYNMSERLKVLLPSLINRGYSHIYILDDCSTDKSDQLVSSFGHKDISFSSSTKNLGAGPTRNRILDYQKNGIVHFLDADMELAGTGNITANIVNAFNRHEDASVIGFRVLNPDSTQFDWNYGPRRSISDYMTYRSWRVYKRINNNSIKRALELLFGSYWKKFWNFMHPGDEDIEQEVGVVVECNMAVRLEDFAAVNGFDNRLRFHEIHDLAYKLKAIGKTIWYVPEVTALKHNEPEDVRPNRKKDMKDSARLLDYKRFTNKY
jgi:N-acetylglucosaminyl-diphospho-decaprenol L-rhamnosyltransferase